ncbi:MAG: thioredoxin family protein [Hoeflea sp.]|uniref:SoxW family protein n=1 Tax=Hoeflea sp. TaxID=1940281 RepID=UPI001E037914|nr:thioredoxin family protein [Hoeflea sp.]MBU4528803.1 thioredoxin family protein [Alphaproteobacteria bacterium]MBU4545870.1 thioredoxin family protein [Alphaproteobacteria bacterium]MBU4549937.1 thioredoxin family protein [Alphaproteobacteria bacterium]MBV1725934.1 thioredoxin family protein [Hoeflea sp.]MBV1762659.1 thioredoxin family protein [Hoeflea sp.]
MFRRAFLTIAAVAALSAQAWSSEIGEDGLHKEEWFSLTFRDVAEDIEAAKDEGKRLVMIFEQRGCIYCAQMHTKILSDPEVSDFIKANFKVVQYNMFGDEEVTDLDGEVLTEKTAARKWGYVFTPTMVFLPEDAPEGMTVAEAAVATMPGAFGKWTFLNMFKWVSEKGYEGEEHFQKYHARIINEMRAAGRLDAE